MSQNNTFSSLKYLMMVLQIAGLLPVKLTNSPYTMQFKWTYWSVIYSIFVMASILFVVLLCFIDWFVLSYDFDRLIAHIFYMGSLVTLYLHFKLALVWPDFIRRWCAVDKTLSTNYGYPESLDKRIRIFSAIFLLLSFGDYILNESSHLSVVYHKFPDNLTIHVFLEENFKRFFNHVPYNIFFGLYFALIAFYATMAWFFNDLFIIILSICLALRFRQITRRLNDYKKKIYVYDNFWSEVREDYDRLCDLCSDLDEQISYITMLSFSMNMFFILAQLYHTLSPMTYTMEKVYFIYSFGYVILKLVLVSLYAAWINDESTEPASILNSVPSTIYNIEIKRFLQQVSFDNVALTGNRMFKITRGLILNIAGAIVTYELVLIQFNSEAKK